MIRVILILCILGAAVQIGRAAVNMSDAREAARVAVLKQAGEQ